MPRYSEEFKAKVVEKMMPPNARTVAETLRKREWKRLRRTLSSANLKQFKNVHWLLRHRRADLTNDEQRILNQLLTVSPKLKEAYDTWEALTAIYESSLSKGQGKRKIRGWVQSVTTRQLSCLIASSAHSTSTSRKSPIILLIVRPVDLSRV